MHCQCNLNLPLAVGSTTSSYYHWHRHTGNASAVPLAVVHTASAAVPLSGTAGAPLARL